MKLAVGSLFVVLASLAAHGAPIDGDSGDAYPRQCNPDGHDGRFSVQLACDSTCQKAYVHDRDYNVTALVTCPHGSYASMRDCECVEEQQQCGC